MWFSDPCYEFSLKIYNVHCLKPKKMIFNTQHYVNIVPRLEISENTVKKLELKISS